MRKIIPWLCIGLAFLIIIADQVFVLCQGDMCFNGIYRLTGEENYFLGANIMRVTVLLLLAGGILMLMIPILSKRPEAGILRKPAEYMKKHKDYRKPVMIFIALAALTSAISLQAYVFPVQGIALVGYLLLAILARIAFAMLALIVFTGVAFILAKALGGKGEVLETLEPIAWHLSIRELYTLILFLSLGFISSLLGTSYLTESILLTSLEQAQTDPVMLTVFKAAIMLAGLVHSIYIASVGIALRHKLTRPRGFAAVIGALLCFTALSLLLFLI